MESTRSTICPICPIVNLKKKNTHRFRTFLRGYFQTIRVQTTVHHNYAFYCKYADLTIYNIIFYDVIQEYDERYLKKEKLFQVAHILESTYTCIHV